MKKIIITVAVVCVAVFANAAAMSWSTAATVIDPTGAEACGNSQITMYLWSIDKATYDTLNTGNISANVWSSYSGNLSSATAHVLEEEGAMSLEDTSKTYSSGETAYAAILFAYDPDGSEITYYKGNIGEWEFTTAADKTISDMDIKIGGSGAALTWTATPEPTSGLLLLLGIAGLALRRRRA